MSRMGWERPEDWIEQEQFEAESDLRGRLFFFRFIIVLVFGLLLFRVLQLQGDPENAFSNLADDNQFATLTTNPARGVIFDRNNTLLAENIPSFNVSITPAFLPNDDDARQAVFERLSFLTGVPITNTVQQQQLVKIADDYDLSTTRKLAALYGAPANQTLDESGVLIQLPDSIAGIVDTFSFAENQPHVITSNVSIDLARVIEQERIFMPGVSVIPEPIRQYPTGIHTAHIIGFMGPLPNVSYLAPENGSYERDDRVGLFGLESYMETELRGSKGEREIEVDWRNRELRQIGVPIDPLPGFNLHLTLDNDLQKATYESLESWLQKRRETRDLSYGVLEAGAGAVVALNPKTGEILSLVSFPSFDNNLFSTEIPVEYYLGLARDDYQPLFNKAIGGQYPPGSVFKLITGAAAMQKGIVSPNRYLATPGAIVIPNKFSPNDPGRAQEFVCWIWNAGGEERTHERMNMYTALQNSCDIYFYKISGGFNQDGEQVAALGIDSFQLIAEEFGMGRVQGIELPAEAPGIMPTKAYKAQNFGELWSTGDDYNSAIGQGFVLATPLQIAQMAAVVANGGFLYKPSIIHHMTDSEGRIVLTDDDDNVAYATPDDANNPVLFNDNGETLPPGSFPVTASFDEDGNYIFQPEVLNVVNVNRNFLQVIADGMKLVNEEGGTAALLPWLDEWGITTAGKTGTAEFCDNLALKKDWCVPPGSRKVQPTHAWYVGYAPFEDPEIVVVAFLYYSGDGSAWAAPVVQDVMKAYFHLDQYAPVEAEEDTNTLLPDTIEIRPAP